MRDARRLQSHMEEPEATLDEWTRARATAVTSDPTRRAELTKSETSVTAANDLAVRQVDENGGGPGVRLRGKPKRETRKNSWRSATWTRLDADFAEQIQFSVCAPQHGEARGTER